MACARRDAASPDDDRRGDRRGSRGLILPCAGCPWISSPTSGSPRFTSPSRTAAWIPRRWRASSRTTTSTTSSTSPGIEHVESKSIQGAALMKLVFHPGTDMSQAMAQMVGYVNRARAFMPPGTVPPFIMRFDAGSVPVGQLVFSSPTRSPGEMQDLALNRVRPLFATLPGVSAPPPFGGNQRTDVIRLDPDVLRSYRISPEEAIARRQPRNVDHAVRQRADRRPDPHRIDERYRRREHQRFARCADSRRAPGRPVYLRDIGDGRETAPTSSTGYAHVNGKRTVYIPVTKRSDASTLAVVDRGQRSDCRFQGVVPDDVNVSLRVRSVAHT